MSDLSNRIELTKAFVERVNNISKGMQKTEHDGHKATIIASSDFGKAPKDKLV